MHSVGTPAEASLSQLTELDAPAFSFKACLEAKGQSYCKEGQSCSHSLLWYWAAQSIKSPAACCWCVHVDDDGCCCWSQVLGGAAFLFMMLRPFLKHISKESRRCAELLVQLPPDFDVEGMVAATWSVVKQVCRSSCGLCAILISLALKSKLEPQIGVVGISETSAVTFTTSKRQCGPA